MAKVHAYLNFNGNCEEAFKFYETVFDMQNIGIHKMGDMPASPDFQLPENAKDKVMHTALFINESTMLMGSDIVEEFGQKYVQGNNSYVMLDAETADEAKKLYDRLSVHAKVMEIPLGEQFFAELFASFIDQFGIPWMIHFEGNKAQQM
ncbi:VOC family protein [Empedobacter falsenii]